MKKTTIISKTAFILLSVFFSAVAYAQLPAFTVQANASPAACGGTGSVTFTVSGINPAATVTYSLYMQPNTTTPVVITTNTTIASLSAGNYTVQATQTLGALSNSAPPENFTVESLVTETIFDALPTNTICGNDGKFTVVVSSGNAPFTYALYAGTSTTNPIVPPQSSNVFDNLAPGGYTIRVTNSCGTSNNQYKIIGEINNNITIGPASLDTGILPTCSTIVATNNFSVPPNGVISYPLTFTYTVTNPNGGLPTVITQVVTAGSIVEQAIPFYNNQPYSYSLQVTNTCGESVTRNFNVNSKFSVTFIDDAANCSDNMLYFTVSTYRPPFTVNFTTAPAGFNPSVANPQHPVFNEDNISYGDGILGSVPDGNYVAVFTDACGNTFTTQTLVIEYPEVDVSAVGNAECGAETGFLRAYFNIEGRTVTQVIITEAPQAYTDLILPVALPQNVSQFITPIPTTGFLMEGMPLGMYTLEITDSCGVTYTKEVNVTPLNGGLILNDPIQRPGCAPDIGTIRISDPVNGPVLTSVIITQTNTGMPVPNDVSANIATNGAFYMGDLPQGNYTFEVVGGNCGGSTILENVPVIGYQPSTTEPVITQNCGSFSINVNDNSNSGFAESFWLQKLDPVTGSYGHPVTAVLYPEGTQPTAQNSVNILNATQLFPYSGQFRVIRVFFTFSTGNSFNNRCIEVIKQFEIAAGPVIEDVIKFPCVNGTIEGTVIATGVAPLTYKLYDSNDNLITNNANSNVFANLTNGDYIVKVTDNCANETPFPFTVTAVDPIVIMSEGNFCEGQPSSLYVQDYSFLLYEWTKTDNPGDVLSTANSIEFTVFNSDTDAGEYQVRIYSEDNSPCFAQILTYTVNPNVLPNAGEDNSPVICNDGTVISLNTYLSANHNTGGIWTDDDNTGALINNTFNPAGLTGTYRFTYTVTDACGGFNDDAIITITLKNIPQAPVVNSVPTVCEGGQVQLVINTPVTAGVYQWTGPDGFSSSDVNPVLNNISMAGNGLYTVTVTENDCTSQPAGVSITVNAVPAITIEGDIQLCNGQSGYLSAEGDNLTGTETYQWYYNNNLMQGVTGRDIQIFETGTYSAIATNNSCSSLQASIDVVKNQTGFEILLDKGCRDDRYMVWVTNLTDLPEAVFAWTGPEGFTATGPEIDITGKAKGEYVVTITNIQGCTASEEIDITNTSCMIPKGVSPNNDGFNDTFDLTNLDVKHLIIYNRYGLKVYEANNYINEWHGQSDKGKLPTGTYYYVITLQSKTVTGWVYLQREM